MKGEQNVEDGTTKEMTQLKAQVMQLTEQLVEQEAREQLLVEQNTHLEEQAQLARELRAHVKQQIFERQAREKILVEQNARLKERARLSRDLHDSVKQHVFALAVQIELARSRLDQDRVAMLEHLTAADELSYQIQQELSTLIDALRPADLQTKALPTALRDYLTTWSRQTHIMVDLSFPHTCLLPSEIEEALWRVTQEVFSNVARHSQGSRATLCLEWTAQQVTLTLSDNGQGFDPQAVEHKGIGLRSIRERIEQVGGTVLIHSRYGAGTQIVARCPLPRSSGNAPAEDEVSR
jgi:two-component system, NarL family, sensor histidine kinase LiaS